MALYKDKSELVIVLSAAASLGYQITPEHGSPHGLAMLERALVRRGKWRVAHGVRNLRRAIETAHQAMELPPGIGRMPGLNVAEAYSWAAIDSILAWRGATP